MGDFQQVLSADDGYITDELRRRPPAKTDYLQEKLALQDLAQQARRQGFFACAIYGASAAKASIDLPGCVAASMATASARFF
jgi:hypothetical protein